MAPSRYCLFLPNVKQAYLFLGQNNFLKVHKKNIAVLMGGYSSEAQISIKSGATVVNSLDSDTYNIYTVHILKEAWVVLLDNKKIPINRADFSFLQKDKKITFDTCYNTIHGSPGEDGKMQAYLELLEIPQSSCNYYESALTFNKRDTLSVLRPYGIAMARSIYLSQGAIINDEFRTQLHSKIGYPCFVKPNRAGSSYGISKVYKEEQLEVALEKAYKEDSQILIESFLNGTEVSVGVYDFGKGVQVLPVCEIIPDGDFFDFTAKYSGSSQEIVPARLSKAHTQQVQDLTARIYSLLNLKGICRIDFIFHEDAPHFVEVNTNPGLSKESIIPRQFKAAGLSLESVFSAALEAASK